MPALEVLDSSVALTAVASASAESASNGGCFDKNVATSTARVCPDAQVEASGRSILAVTPPPGVSSSHIQPPCASTSERASARPKPAPPV